MFIENIAERKVSTGPAQYRTKDGQGISNAPHLLGDADKPEMRWEAGIENGLPLIQPTDSTIVKFE